MHYAVRGEVVIRADELQKELDAGAEKPFSSMVFTNIGNPHAVGQPPLTFFRQVLALCDLGNAQGIDNPNITRLFPQDAIDRARQILDALEAEGVPSLGAYTDPQGALCIRQDVARFLEAKDGFPADPDHIFMVNGASAGIEYVLTALIESKNDAVMIPIPQYPIYSALITLLGGHQVGYPLEEADGWSVSVSELEKQLAATRAEGKEVKAFVLINPGNPTGQVMSEEVIADIAAFCAKERICLLADEVYQANVYSEHKQFVGAKKAALQRGVTAAEGLELFSFHSTSKGLIGECGRRGGYVECYGVRDATLEQVRRLAALKLCPGVAGQIMVSLMLHPPVPGDASYESYRKEEQDIYDGLKKGAALLVQGLNDIEGITCNASEGAMYAFPRVEMPPGAIAKAKEMGMSVDTLYAVSLLEATGVCVVPASGFGQAEGRAGFRTTFLPPEPVLRDTVKRIGEHHRSFVAKYS